MTSDSLFAGWARLGVFLDAPPAPEPPEVETLLLRTAAAVHRLPLLGEAAATWLARHGRLVDPDRLLRRSRESANGGDGSEVRACVLALLIDAAAEHTDLSTLATFTAASIRLEPPVLLCDLHRRVPALGRRAAARPGRHAAARGLLAYDPLVRPKILRPDAWVFEHNPGLAAR